MKFLLFLFPVRKVFDISRGREVIPVKFQDRILLRK